VPRHAYMIMAHRDFWVLERLLLLLDDERNDIYVHIDAKSPDCDVKALAEQVHRAQLSFVTRIPVKWGRYSQIAAQILLLRTATQRPHRYYHLLSGADLPLVTQNEAHRFFEDNDGKEFVHYSEDSESQLARVTLRHFLLPSLETTPASLHIDRLLGKVDKWYVGAQAKLGTNVFGTTCTPKKGANWFSITDDAASFLLQSEPWIRRKFRSSVCGDEFVVQTLIWHSQFRANLYGAVDDDYRACLRKIDWQRGFPYTWRSEDLQELVDAPAQGFLFARKFDSSVDAGVIKSLFELLRQQDPSRGGS
jgi:hypothetical protein